MVLLLVVGVGGFLYFHLNHGRFDKDADGE
jgi:hypothetical protein